MCRYRLLNSPFVELKRHTGLTSKSFATLLTGLVLREVRDFSGKKKRPSREYRTLKVLNPGESDNKISCANNIKH